jgi:hypothetical protein
MIRAARGVPFPPIRRAPRENLLKSRLLLMGLAVLASGSFTLADAQEGDGGPPQYIDPAFSTQLLSSLGYPTLMLRETGTGIVGLPDKLPAGRYRVSMEAPQTTPVHLLLVQPPKGLSREKAEALLLEAGGNDRPQEGWVYGGGAFAPPGTRIEFLIDLKPGNWSVATTRVSARPSGGCGGSSSNGKVEEWATLQPLQVTAGTLPEEPAVGVTVEMEDFAFAGMGDTLTTGPKIWKLTATGTRPRHMTFFRTPKLLTGDDLLRILTTPEGEAPPDGLPSFSEFVWSGDVSMMSPGYATWIEFNLKPGYYMLMCWNADTDDAPPAVFFGMTHGFTVEEAR